MEYRYFDSARRQTLLGLLGLALAPLVARASLGKIGASQRLPHALRVPPYRPDALAFASPSEVQIGGWLGRRIDLNAQRRLMHLDMVPLLAGFIQKPGSHPWIGEHVGKWIHAATLAWAYQGSDALRAKLDAVVRDLVATQESDGYLGTYLPTQRFGLFAGADWDVWTHKYCLIGLLTYHQYTGDPIALQAAKRAADLMIEIFPAKRSILAAGVHHGLAATSVLEPIILLYRVTADDRYLNFARYIVKSWDEAGGPALLKTLLNEKQVFKVVPPKAYEMLSNLVGLVELARVTGESSLRDACLNAWQDIFDKRLYITGGTSQDEHFQADHDLRDNGQVHVSETCVTTTWIQFNMALLQLTGESRFADQIELSTYNHLTAAQHPAGDDWCYFTPLHGRKRYLQSPEITCCQSSGPRGLALVPQFAFMKERVDSTDTLVVNTFETSSASMSLGGQGVVVEMLSNFPRTGGCQLVLRMAQPAHFGLRVRHPAWAESLGMAEAKLQDGWRTIAPRNWENGEKVDITFTLTSSLLPGNFTNSGKAAMRWGPFVLAYEDQSNPELPPAHQLGWSDRAAKISSPPDRAPLRFKTLVRVRPKLGQLAIADSAMISAWASLLTYADAGAKGSSIRVWLRASGRNERPPTDSLLLDGVESRSRGMSPMGKGNSFNDDDLESWVSTFDGTAVDEDWFAVALPRLIVARRFTFSAGRVSEDGGWFDARQGKPRVQVQRTTGADWQTIGTLDGYPDTTATEARDVGNDWDLAAYTLNVQQPVEFVAVRVIGRPAGGKDPTRPYVTCAALQAFSS